MPDPNAVWGALLGAGLAYELYGVFVRPNKGLTLSERLRAWLRTNTKPGKAIFVIAWLALTAWFIPHIING